MASSKASVVLNGYLNLTAEDQAEFKRQLLEFEQAPYERKVIKKASVRTDADDTVRFAPLGGGCTCCGR